MEPWLVLPELHSLGRERTAAATPEAKLLCLLLAGPIPGECHAEVSLKRLGRGSTLEVGTRLQTEPSAAEPSIGTLNTKLRHTDIESIINTIISGE